MSTPRNESKWARSTDDFDPKFFKSALKTKDIYIMDYYLLRVFHNPDYSEKLNKELRGQVETTNLKRLPILNNSVRDNNLHVIRMTLQSLFDAFHSIELSEFDKDMTLRGLSWYLIVSSLSQYVDNSNSPPKLIEYINQLNSKLNSEYKVVMFMHLIELCNSRVYAEMARKNVRFLVQMITEGEKNYG